MTIQQAAGDAPRNLFDAITRRAARQPQSPALILPGREMLDYRTLLERSARIAHVLAAHGARPGDRVMVQVEKSAEALCLYLACLQAGAVYVPLNNAYTAAELAYFVADANPKIFVCAPAARETVAAVTGAHVLTLGDDGRQGSLLEECAGHAAEFPSAGVGMNHVAVIIYTSGTTGRSKGAMLSHANLWSNAEALRVFWRFTGNDVLLHALPLFHVHGLFVAGNVSLLAGGAMILLPKFDVGEIFHWLPHADVMMGVPTFYTRLLGDSRLTPEAARHVRLFTSGSAPLLADTHRQWQARTGHAILERYGMSEAGMIASNPFDGARVPGSVGYALPDVEVRVVARSGAPAPPGEVGMIEVRGPNVFQGYWQMPDKIEAEFREDGFFITGDLGTMEADGRLSIVGRGKDLIITGGLNVYPKEIESLIDAIPGVAESAVIGLPHADFGEGVTAVVVATDAGLTQAAVLAALADRLARFKLPKRVLFRDGLPRNTMGKVQKNRLREEFRDLYQAG
ncbi:MAG TPA: malonyl-CoA synthase [Rhizomicrobium sp.]|nr:malonyl-CoA synthase [Rhizomicrobium sp.]